MTKEEKKEMLIRLLMQKNFVISHLIFGRIKSKL